jgi:hypothetical protein
MEDLDRRRGAFRLDPRDVDRDVAFVQLREEGVADEQLARLLDPVLAESRLDRMHDRAAQPHGEVAEMLAVLRVDESTKQWPPTRAVRPSSTIILR